MRKFVVMGSVLYLGSGLGHNLGSVRQSENTPKSQLSIGSQHSSIAEMMLFKNSDNPEMSDKLNTFLSNNPQSFINNIVDSGSAKGLNLLMSSAHLPNCFETLLKHGADLNISKKANNNVFDFIFGNEDFVAAEQSLKIAFEYLTHDNHFLLSNALERAKKGPYAQSDSHKKLFSLSENKISELSLSAISIDQDWSNYIIATIKPTTNSSRSM